MLKKMRTFLFLLILAGITIPSYGASHYVDKNANGSNDGTSWTNAWEGFSNINWGSISPGDIIYISGGNDSTVYNETLTIGKSGTNGNNIVITKGNSAGHTGKVVIDGQNARSYCLNYNSKQYVTVSYLSLRNSTDRVIYMRTSNVIASHLDIFHTEGIEVLDLRGSNCIIEYCTSDQTETPVQGTFGGNGDFAQVTTGGGHIFRYNHITLRNNNVNDHCDVFQFYGVNSDCYIYGNFYQHLDTKTTNAQGTYMTTSNITLYVYNNVAYFPYAKSAIGVNNVGGYLGRIVAYGNTFYQGSGGNQYLFIIATPAPNNIIKNNILYSANSTAPLYLSSGATGDQIDNNILYSAGSYVAYYNGSSKNWSQWRALGYDANGYNVNPNFVNVGSDPAGFEVQAGSQAIDHGFTLGSPYNVDLDQISRPQGSGYDIGAHEMMTGGGGNNPPNQPANPNPGNGAVNQPTSLTLTWSCTDPDGDPLTYDVYFGTSNNPQLVSGNQTSTSYNPGQLNNSTTYYWKIVAKDNQGASTSGPLWNFSTAAGIDVTPPEVLNASLLDSVTLHIIFSEPLEQSGAENPNNYAITNNISVLSATLSNSEVTLTTSQHLPNIFYTVTVSNVTDLAGNLISSSADTAGYQFIVNNGLTQLPIDSAYAAAWYQNYTPPKAIDGITEPINPESRWGGALPMPDSIMFDLGQNKLVGQTRFSFYEWNAGRIYTYSIYSSVNGNTWSPIAENINSSSSEWSVLSFNLIECRYIKLISLSNNQSQWAGLYEAELWGLDPTPVELTSFDANFMNGKVNILWNTATETNCYGYQVQKRGINTTFGTIGFVNGNGTSSVGHTYNYEDQNLSESVYYYRLRIIDYNGQSVYSQVAKVNIEYLTKYELRQNYPNPFNPSTSIKFTVPQSAFVTLKIYDILGKEVAILVNEEKETGSYDIKFNAKSLPSGVYFCRLQSGNFVETRKMMLLK